MTGTVILAGGTRKTLPGLLSWRFIHTDGVGSDGFSVSFCFSPVWEEILRQAIRFEAEENGVVRFYGIVDEYEICWTGDGLVAEVHGRGLAGLLMDNHVSQKEYYWVRLSDMLRNYATPYGVTDVAYTDNYRLQAYAVDYGDCCWDALCGFCLWAADVQPRFSPEGKLIISPEKGKTHTLRQSQVTKALWRTTRYGVYSAVVAKYAGTLYEERIENDEFLAMGGCAVHRMTIPRKNRCRAGLESPRQVLENSKKKFQVLEVTVPEPFYASPVDVIQAELPKLGVSGKFLVTETENSRDISGSRCTITMRKLN